MFRGICAPLSSYLTPITAVSLRPVLSRSVKEIFYVCNRYRVITTIGEYQEALYDTCSSEPEKKAPRSEEETADLKSAFSQYGQHYNDQIAMESSGEVIARLTSALMRMPNIEKVTISPNYYAYLDSYQCSKYFLLPEPSYNEAFLLMARLLSITDSKIQELDIESSDDWDGGDCGVSGAVFRNMSNMSLRHCCIVFSDLRKVKMSIIEDDGDGWETGHLALSLSCATKLESLWISGGGYASSASNTL